MKQKNIVLRNAFYGVLPAFSMAAIFGAWFLISAVKIDFPTPIQVYREFIDLANTPISRVSLPGHVWFSIQRVLIAFAFASTIGVALGLGMGWSRSINAFVGPVFEILRPIPPIAWIPLVILWFGVGEVPKVIIVFIGAFIPVVLNTYTGTRMVDSLYLDAGRLYGASQRQLFSEIVIPATFPAIFAGMTTALSSGWMCVLAAEMIGAKAGVGFLIVRGMESGNPAMIISCMIIIGIVGAIISIGLAYVERWICPWRSNR